MAGTVAYIDGAGGDGRIINVSAANPLPVNGIAVTVADFNLNKVAGAAVKTGHGTASGAQRVELPTDGTGVVGLNAGTNAIGTLIGDTYSHISTSTTTVVKNAAGTVKAVNVNTKGTVASTVTVKDDTTTIAIIDSLNLSGTWQLNVACLTNITVVTTGTQAPDVTVTYQ